MGHSHITIGRRIRHVLLHFGRHDRRCQYLPWALENLVYSGKHLRRLMADELCRQHDCKVNQSGPWARRPYGPVDPTDAELARELERDRAYEEEVRSWKTA